MKRLLSIVLALVLVLGTLPAFAYDYNVAGKSAGQMLYDNGFIKGNNGDLMEAKKLSRAELAKILCVLYGKEKEAEAFEANHGFTDVPAGHWANPWIAYAKQEGWMKGRNEKTFDPNGTVDEKQLATVLLRVLGFETKDDEYNNAAQIFAAKTAIVLDANKAFSRGQAFDAIWPAVSTPVKADGKILGEVVGKLNPPTPDPLTIKDVQANNLKEIVVKFSKEVKDVTKESFSLSDNLKISNVKLAEDALSVVVTLKNNMTNQRMYKLSVKDVKAADAKVPAFVEVKDLAFNCFDKFLPTVTGVEFTGPKHITVMFSETMGENKTAVPVVKVGKGKLYPNTPKTKWATDMKSVTFEMNSDFKQDQEYEITIEGFKDLLGYGNELAVIKKVYAKDSTTPTVEVVEVDQKSVTLKFSKPVIGLKPDYFSHTFSGYTALSVNDETAEITKPVQDVVVDFWGNGSSPSKHALPAGKVKFSISGTKIVDLWGNKFGDLDIDLNVTGDDSKPEIAELKATANTTLEVTFTKPVTFTSANITVMKGSDKVSIASVGAVAGKKNKVWEVALTGTKQGDKLDVEIKNVVDKTVNENKMSVYTNKIEIPDTTPPSVQKITYKSPVTGSAQDTSKPAKITVWFDSQVDDSALDLNNYGFIKNGKFYKIGGYAEFVAGFEGVRISVDDATRAEFFSLTAESTLSETGANKLFLTVENIKDYSGIALAKQTIDINGAGVSGVEGAYKASIESLVITSPKEATITFSHSLKAIANTDITFANVTGGLGNADFSIVEQSEKVVKIKITKDAKKFQADPEKATAVTVAAEADNKIETEAEIPVDTAAKNAVDKIAPEFVNKLSGLVPTNKFDAAVTESSGDTKVTFQLTEPIALVKTGVHLGELMTIVHKDSAAGSATTIDPLRYGTDYTIEAVDKTLVVTINNVNLTDGTGDTLKITFTDAAFQQLKDKAAKPNLVKKFVTSVFEYTKE